jgi:hypothetical protein
MMAGQTTYRIKAVVQAVDKLTGPVRRMATTIQARLGGALRRLGGITNKMGRLFHRGLGLAGIASSGLIAAIGGLIKGFLSSVGPIGKFARQVGLSVEALQELQYAAHQSGVVAETFKKSLLVFSRGIGQARLGTGALNTMLLRLPPSFRDAIIGASSMDEAVRIMLEGLAAVADPADRSALAVAAFGRGGMDMVHVAAKGAAGIARLRQEARDLGLVFDEEATEAASAMNAEMKVLSATIGGLRNAIGFALIPVVRPLLTALKDWIVANRALIATKIAEWISAVVNWVRRFDFSAIAEGFRVFFGVVGRVFDALGGVKGVLIAIAAIKLWPLVTAMSGIPALIGAIAFSIGAVIAAVKQAEALQARRAVSGVRITREIAQAAAAEDRPEVRRGLLRTAVETRAAVLAQEERTRPIGWGGFMIRRMESGWEAAMLERTRSAAVRGVAADLERALKARSAMDPTAVDLRVSVRDDRVDVTRVSSTGPSRVTVDAPVGARISGGR